MSDYLFETPWWLPTAIIAAGVVVFISGNRRVKPPMRNLGLAIVGLAIVLMVVSYWVETAKERAVARTRQLVEAVVRRDQRAMQSILEADTIITSSNNLTLFAGRDAIINAALAASEIYGLERAIILSLDAQRVQTEIDIDLTVLTFSNSQRSTRSGFHLNWQQRADGWHLMSIQVLTIDDRDPSQFLGRLGARGR